MVKQILKNILNVLLFKERDSFYKKWLSAAIWCFIIMHILTFSIEMYIDYFYDPFSERFSIENMKQMKIQ